MENDFILVHVPFISCKVKTLSYSLMLLQDETILMGQTVSDITIQGFKSNKQHFELSPEA